MARKPKKAEREPWDYPEHVKAVRSLVVRFRDKGYSDAEIVAAVGEYLGEVSFRKLIELAAKQIIRDSEGNADG